MKLNKKILLSGLGVIGLGATTALSVGCGNGSSKSTTSENNKKEIVIAVDGVQKDFYNKVIEEFNKTEAHKVHGYKIVTLEKDVFSAKEIGTTGANDYAVVPDIFYAPEITDLVSKNAVTDLNKFDPELFNTIATQLGLTDEEKETMLEYGNVEGIVRNSEMNIEKRLYGEMNIEKRLYGIRHNVEGIVMASNLDYKTTKELLSKDETNSLKELVQNGLAIIRLQDFWYGAGIMGGVFSEIAKSNPTKKDLQDLMAKILYSNGVDAKSGFIENDTYHKEFRKGIEAAVDLVFPIWEAAYMMNEEEYAQSVWAKRGISQSDLEAVIDKDMGTVQQKVWELLKAKKINFAIVGTWDVQNTQKNADANTFINVIKVTDESPYVQQPGAWSYAINSRNNGAAASRKEAISTLLRIIFTLDPYKAYFKSDSKIPYSKHMQDQLKASVDNELAESNKEFTQFYKSLGYENAAEFLDAYSSQSSVISKSESDNGQWSIDNSNEPLNEANIVTPSYGLEELNSSEWQTLKSSLQPVTGLRNAIAAMLGIELPQLQGAGQQWQIGTEIMNESFLSAQPDLVQDVDLKTLHVRKVENFIFGANGDNGEDKKALYTKIITALENNTLDELSQNVKAKALEFSRAASKVEVAEETVAKAAQLYFDNYVNNARIRALAQKANELAFIKKDGIEANVTLGKVQEEVNKYEKNNAINKILEVVTSRKSLANNGLGTLTTLKERIDHSNPQFGSTVWGIWNDSTFGNKEFIKKTASEVKIKISANPSLNAKDEFVGAVVKQMSDLYRAKTNVINDSNLQLVVTFE